MNLWQDVGQRQATSYDDFEDWRDQSTSFSRLIAPESFPGRGGGLPIGMAGALGVGQVLQAFMVQTHPYDPVTLVMIVLVLVVVAVLACVQPARRAAALDPMTALRYE